MPMEFRSCLSIISICSFLFFLGCQQEENILSISKGLQIDHTVKIRSKIYEIPSSDSLNQPILIIEGSGIEIDFQNAHLTSTSDKTKPNQFKGLGILIRNGKNITIKNLKVSGFKIAVMAENVDSLRILDSDLSYNFRQKLYSTREREDLGDWMSYHLNEKDEWMGYGAALYLKNCNAPLVCGLIVSQGQNGIMMTHTQNGLFYNNTIQFNSGIGIGLYRSSNNRIMHNKLDWNVRGHSPGIYARGQDSAALLCYEQSNNNTFAYNSASHSGDGFFLWAGQTTMDTGKGGCNDNMISDNDFSYAPTNGIEVTFSRNYMINNKLNGCRYGVWGGYSFESLIYGNEIKDCDFGIAIEHGQDNTLANNLIQNNKTGIQLWARATQPTDWGYARARDVSSRDYLIEANHIENTETVYKISASKNIEIKGDNQAKSYKKLLEVENPNENLNIEKQQDGIDQLIPVGLQAQGNLSKQKPNRLEDGMETSLPANQLQGRDYMLINEWGPYNFQYPTIWLRNIEEDQYTFLVLGPQGNWKMNGGSGFVSANPKTGTFPATIVAQKEANAKDLEINLIFIGDTIVNQFGEVVPGGMEYPVRYSRIEPGWKWEVSWYNYPDTMEAVFQKAWFKNLVQTVPQQKATVNSLAYRWWGSPAEGISADHFATIATTEMELPEGQYRLYIASDDGVMVYLDEALILEHWNIHTPETKEIEVQLGGKHRLNLIHFEATGLATLDVRVEKIP